MDLTQQQKNILYHMSSITLKWSLVYLLVLFFLEDSRPFMVSTVLNPAWLFVPLCISLLGVLLTAPFGHEHTKTNTQQRLTRFDVWAVRIVFVLLGVWLTQLIDLSLWAGVLVLFCMLGGYYVTMQLFNSNS